MFKMSNKIRLTVFTLIVLAGLLIAFYYSEHANRLNKVTDLVELKATYLDHPRTIKSFSLTGIDAKPFTNANLLGHWTLIFFGFSNCSRVCPTTMAELAKMLNSLVASGAKNLPTIMMISIDPERDNLDRLGHYVRAFHPDFYAATGSRQAIKRLAAELGIAYTQDTHADQSIRQIDNIEHTATLVLFNPRGELNAFFTTPHKAEILARDYQLIAEND
ncbi:MAG: SCO family protein [Legionella sp.]